METAPVERLDDLRGLLSEGLVWYERFHLMAQQQKVAPINATSHLLESMS
jgi:hypothetical protein